MKAELELMRRLACAGVSLVAATGLAACSSVRTEDPITTAAYVDLDRFMGDWYVIASIPTFIEKDIYNAVESYRINEDGNIATTFTFRKGGFDGEAKRYEPTGFVRDEQSNAVWAMQFLWPIKADYRIVYVDDEYQRTIIGRNKRDFVWIMAREPVIDDADYASMVEMLQDEGYDTSELRKVPQRWNQ